MKFQILIPLLLIGAAIAASATNIKSIQANAPHSRNTKLATVKRVADGDTLTTQDGQKIRLCGIDAPEKDQPLGIQSKLFLERMLLGQEIIISPVEKDRYGRTIAEVYVPSPTAQQPEREQFVNGEMVGAGLAYHYDRYSGNCPNQNVIIQAEAIAQAAGLGVWKGNHQKPWDYRKTK